MKSHLDQVQNSVTQTHLHAQLVLELVKNAADSAKAAQGQNQETLAMLQAKLCRVLADEMSRLPTIAYAATNTVAVEDRPNLLTACESTLWLARTAGTVADEARDEFNRWHAHGFAK